MTNLTPAIECAGNALIPPRSARVPALMAALMLLSSCGIYGDSNPDANLIPDDPGMYAVVDGEPATRLDGPKEWELKTWGHRSDLDNSVKFVIRHPALATLSASPEKAVRIKRVGYVRSEIDERGQIQPLHDTNWEVANNPDFDVPVNLRRLTGQPDSVLVVPLRPLNDGLYSLQMHAGGQQLLSRFGVHWSQVDKEQYSSVTCIDRYRTTPVVYKACDEQPVAIVSKGLQLHLVDPERVDVAGEPALVVRGVVVNTSGKQRQLPMLEARLRDASGNVLKRWHFAPESLVLAPGKSAQFRTVAEELPPTLKDIQVDFAGTGMSATRTGN